MDLTKRFPAHPSEDILEEYVFRRLPEPLARHVEEHLLICPACQQTVEKTDELIALLKSAAAHPAELAHAGGVWNTAQESARRMLVPNAGWAAALAMICLAILVFWRQPEEVPLAPVTLSSFRGSEPVSMAPAGKQLRLAIEAPDLPACRNYHVELVRATGERAWEGPAAENSGKLSAKVSKPLQIGLYWVRLYAADGELLREFGLRVE